MKNILFTALMFFPLAGFAEEYQILCITGECYSVDADGVVSRLFPMSVVTDEYAVEAGGTGCRAVFASMDNSFRYMLSLSPEASFRISDIEEETSSKKVRLTRLDDMKTEMIVSGNMALYSDVETRRGYESDYISVFDKLTADDKDVGYSLVGKCNGGIFSIDSLYSKPFDYLISLDIGDFDDREIAVVSNYEPDSLYVAVYAIQRESGNVSIYTLGDMLTFGVAPMSDVAFMVSDSGKTDYPAFFAVASKEYFNYVDTYNTLFTEEGSSQDHPSRSPVGFSMINRK